MRHLNSAPRPDWSAPRTPGGACGEEAGSACRPDSAGVNVYRGGARLGLPGDREELVDDPLVSLSLGTACVFRVGNTENRAARTPISSCTPGIYHGVPRLLPKYGNPPIGTAPGERINVTGVWLFPGERVSGLR